MKMHRQLIPRNIFIRFLILGCCILPLGASAQLAVISDKDGFTNVHDSSAPAARVVDRLYRDELFLFDDGYSNRDWVPVYYTRSGAAKGNGYHKGFIHRSRLQAIASLPHLPDSALHLSNNVLSAGNGLIRVRLVVTPFKAAGHRIGRKADGYVATIDGHEPNGVDGGLPDRQLSGFEIVWKGQKVKVPAAMYQDLYQPGLNSFNIYFGNRNTVYLYMSENSDGGGFYTVAWLLRDGKLLRRYIDTP
jgi:hypothetical protein